MTLVHGKEDVTPCFPPDQNFFLGQLGQRPLDGKEGRIRKEGDMPKGHGGRLTHQNP